MDRRSDRKATGVRPVGWHTRSAASPNTRRLLLEEGGFLYDSDAYNDDLPYIAGDRRAPPRRAALRVRHQRHAVPEHQSLSRRRGFRRLCARGLRLALSRRRGAPKMMSVGLHLRIIGRPGGSARLSASSPRCAPGKASGSRAGTKSRAIGSRSRPRRHDARSAPAAAGQPQHERAPSRAGSPTRPGASPAIDSTSSRSTRIPASRRSRRRTSSIVSRARSSAALAAHSAASAAIIGAFGDPALAAARSRDPRPIFGLGERGLMAAGRRGRRFAVVTLGAAMVERSRAGPRASDWAVSSPRFMCCRSRLRKWSRTATPGGTRSRRPSALPRKKTELRRHCSAAPLRGHGRGARRANCAWRCWMASRRASRPRRRRT